MSQYKCPFCHNTFEEHEDKIEGHKCVEWIGVEWVVLLPNLGDGNYCRFLGVEKSGKSILLSGEPIKILEEKDFINL